MKKIWIKIPMWMIFATSAIFWLWIDWKSYGYIRPHRVTSGFFVTTIALLIALAALAYKIADSITADNIPLLSHFGKLGDWGEIFAKVAIVVYLLIHILLLGLMWSDVQTTNINEMWVDNDMFWLWLFLHLIF